MSKEKDFLSNPILGMGLRPSILLDWEGSGFLCHKGFAAVACKIL